MELTFGIYTWPPRDLRVIHPQLKSVPVRLGVFPCILSLVAVTVIIGARGAGSDRHAERVVVVVQPHFKRAAAFGYYCPYIA